MAATKLSLPDYNIYLKNRPAWQQISQADHDRELSVLACVSGLPGCQRLLSGMQLRLPGHQPIPGLLLSWYDGTTLAERLHSMQQQRRKCTVRWMAGVLSQLLQTLELLHSGTCKGSAVLHLDLKAGNIMLGAQDKVMVIDFGCAQVMPVTAAAAATATDAAAEADTAASSSSSSTAAPAAALKPLALSPHYSSPEVNMLGGVTQQSDL
jgi:serine/threonine protein kinase